MDTKTTGNKTTGTESNVGGNKPDTSSTTGAGAQSAKPSTSGASGISTSGSGASSSGSSGSATSGSSTSGTSNYGSGAATQTSRERESDISNAYRNAEARVSETMNQASQAASEAWNRVSHTASNTYEHTLDFGRDNPGRTILIAFGAGVAVGLLLASTTPSRSRGQRIVPPVMNALSEIVRELLD